jgi:transcriptional regulator
MLGSIVGIELPITRIVGKWKASQNRTAADRASAAAGLRDSGQPEMADLIESSANS